MGLGLALTLTLTLTPTPTLTLTSAPVYNLLPDIMSSLSANRAVTPEAFREVMAFESPEPEPEPEPEP